MKSMVSFITNIFKFMERTLGLRFHNFPYGVILTKTSVLVGNLMEDMVNFIENVFRLIKATIHCHKLSVCP